MEKHDGISSMLFAWSVVPLISVVSISDTMSALALIDKGELLVKYSRPIHRVQWEPITW